MRELYRNASSMEPLFPTEGRAQLEALTCDIFRAAGALSASIPSQSTREQIRALVREMNSYYSNLIEGHKTLPHDIELALKKDFSKAPEEKNNQILSVAHIEAEKETEEAVALLSSDSWAHLHSSPFICRIHEAFYNRLPPHLHLAKNESGQTYRVHPGKPRDYNVDVGGHTPPDFPSLAPFLNRFEAFYGGGEISPAQRLIAIAAAHHRLAWIHPFGDGNGRVMRLHSHALLMHAKVDGLGLWTLSRGLARDRKGYYSHLQVADRPRQGDLDGRGNLSDRGLFEFCLFFLQTMLEQIRFMSGLLELNTLRSRIDLYFEREAFHIVKFRKELAKLVKALLVEEAISRAHAAEILGKGETVTRQVIRLALEEGLVSSPNEKGKLRIAFPAKTHDSYFPRLFYDLNVA